MPPFEEIEDRLADVGEFIRHQRNLASLSVRRLSELSGISNPYLSQIERGLRKPSADILQQIAKGLRISAEQLYVRAGILDPESDAAESPADVRHAIQFDAALRDDQKQTLLRVYESLLAEARSAPIDPKRGKLRESAKQEKG
jgi:transcriptional regulator with XRE-family HTH domain